jgi:hypothetical protein
LAPGSARNGEAIETPQALNGEALNEVKRALALQTAPAIET